MDDLLKQYFPVAFPIFFAFMWLAITTLLSVLSGWFSLMQHYPDRAEDVVLSLKRQSGFMGMGVSMRGILNISVCRSGLRFGIMKIFGPFCRNFFVPWDEISIERKNRLFWQEAQFRFGNPVVGKVSIASYVADRLARAADGRWPEAGTFPEETKDQAFAGVAREWTVATLLAATFFIVVPRIAFPAGAAPPIAVAILFPAVVFGIISVVRYFTRIR